MFTIEEQVDDCEADLDYESAQGILEIIFPDRSKIVINKQAMCLASFSIALARVDEVFDGTSCISQCSPLVGLRFGVNGMRFLPL